jgi:hypothetical protein
MSMKITLKVTGAGNLRRVFIGRQHAAESAIYSIQYDAEHAIPVHEILDAIHAPPTQAKFVEQPFRELRKDMVNHIGQQFSRGRTFRQGLRGAIDKVFHVTQILVPVDTGELKASGRVVREK